MPAMIFQFILTLFFTFCLGWVSHMQAYKAVQPASHMSEQEIKAKGCAISGIDCDLTYSKYPPPKGFLDGDRFPDLSLTRSNSLGVFADGGSEKGAIIYRDGEVELINNTTPSEGAKAFWDTVRLAYPNFCTPRSSTQAPKNRNDSGHLRPLDKRRAKAHDTTERAGRAPVGQ